MHDTHPTAHGMAALAIVEALVHRLIGQKALSRKDALGMCAELKKRFDEKGVRHDNAAETDAALLIADFMTTVEGRN